MGYLLYLDGITGSGLWYDNAIVAILIPHLRQQHLFEPAIITISQYTVSYTRYINQNYKKRVAYHFA